jgi:hypothetical protein
MFVRSTVTNSAEFYLNWRLEVPNSVPIETGDASLQYVAVAFFLSRLSPVSFSQYMRTSEVDARSLNMVTYNRH